MITREEEQFTRTAILERTLINRGTEIEDSDILTDFDGTMIKEESEYMEILAYFLKNSHHATFLKDVIKEYIDYKKTQDVSQFYSLFKGCPVEILDNIVKHVHQDEEWNELIEKIGVKKVGIISRNNGRVISKYLDRLNFPYAEINLVAANNPEIKDGIYTGKVEMIVDNKNLADFIGKKEYICKAEEKRIIEKSGIDCKRLKGGLYICKKRKLF